MAAKAVKSVIKSDREYGSGVAYMHSPRAIHDSAVPDIVSFADQMHSEFARLYGEYKIAEAPDRKKPDMIDAIWEDIYELVFKPGESDIRYNNSKSKLIAYKVDDVESVTKMFIKLNRLYGGVIKYNLFSELTGISRYTLDLWHNANKTNGYIFNLSDSDVTSECNNIYIINNGNGDIEYKGNNRYTLKTNDKLSTLRFDVKKKLNEAMKDSNTNGLSLDSMGQMARANNDEDLGKLYDPKRLMLQTDLKTSIAAKTPEEIAAKYGKLCGDVLRLELPEVPE